MILKQSLGRTLVASIGPVCSAALRKLAVRVDVEAQPPKLGPFIDAINAGCPTHVDWTTPNPWVPAKTPAVVANALSYGDIG
jgi:hypothetical protein